MSGDAQARRPLVAIGSIMHESNSFNPAKTTLKDYSVEERPAPDLLERWARPSNEVAGYIEGARKAGIDLYPTLDADATPKGPLTDDTFNNLVTRLVNHLKAAPKLDGVLLALHGAMVVESYPHGDAEIVRRVR